MNIVFLGLGSNMGNRSANLAASVEWIDKEIGTIVKKSSIYQTAAWGLEAQDDFYNQVIGIETLLEPFDLLKKCQAIEQKMGRISVQKWGPRIIDIDVLFFNDAILQSPTLTIPHPRLAERKFVLIPMCELAKDWQHPVFQKSMEVLLEECKDVLPVQVLIK